MTDADIKNLAHLARIAVTDEEVQKFKSEIGPILDYVAQINTVQIDAITQDHILQNVSREDVASPIDQSIQDAMVKNIPETENGFYKVPKIL